MSFSTRQVPTTPFEGQKPGTSGLRKKAKEFLREHYTENFLQAIFDVVEGASGATLAVGGDGRFLVPEVVQLIIKMAKANGLAGLVVGQHGIYSTPAVSATIRHRKLTGGIILTASHNPGGPDEDFGIKYNIGSGGPAPSSMTDAMFARTKTITEYRTCDLPDVDLSVIASHDFDGFKVDVVDSVADYLDLMKQLFDFGALKKYLASGSCSLRIDCLSGVAGPYARKIFVEELGVGSGSVVNAVPLPDFGGGHPDPNLVYAKELVDAMKEGDYDFGAAFDGDADRNMILGKKGFFVCPSDSVAVIAANYSHIPYLSTGLKGLSRSMPTAGALDRVADYLKVEFFEVPTGWKFFGNLMDAGRLSICGEESFGTGSSHIREKDGVWAVLCWLSILAARKETVEEVCTGHWRKFGRNFFTRYDYEACETEGAQHLMTHLRAMVAQPETAIGINIDGCAAVRSVDEFEYTDPTNGEVTSKQGIRFILEDGSRVVFRLSGTGSSGATVRMYIDSYVNEEAKLSLPAEVALAPLVRFALTVSKLEEFTGRASPSVIT